MKRIMLLATFMLVAVLAFSQSKVIPQSVIMDKALTLKKGGACYAFDPDAPLDEKKQIPFWPGCVFFTDQGLVIGVSAERAAHYQHALGEKTNYFFYPWSEVNKEALESLGLSQMIGLMRAKGQWNVVAIAQVKTGSGNHVRITPVAGKAVSTVIHDRDYKIRMDADDWRPKTRPEGAVFLGIYAKVYFWPFSLWSAANQPK